MASVRSNSLCRLMDVYLPTSEVADQPASADSTNSIACSMSFGRPPSLATPSPSVRSYHSRNGQTSGEVPLPRRDERARHVWSDRACVWGARPAAPIITSERFGHLDSRPNVVGFSRRVKNDCTLTFGAATFGRRAIPHGPSTAGTHPRARWTPNLPPLLHSSTHSHSHG